MHDKETQHWTEQCSNIPAMTQTLFISYNLDEQLSNNIFHKTQEI